MPSQKTQAKSHKVSNTQQVPIWVILLSCLAFGIFWSAGLYFRIEVSSELVFFHYEGRLAKILLCFAVAYIAWRREVNLRRVFIAANVLLCFAVLAFIPVIMLPDTPDLLRVIANTVLGLSAAFYTLLFLQFFSLFDTRFRKASIPFAFMLCHVIFLASMFAPNYDPALLEITASVLAALLLIICMLKINLLKQESADSTSPEQFFMNSYFASKDEQHALQPRRVALSRFFSEYNIVLLGAIVLPFFYGIIAQIYTETGINAGLFDFETELVIVGALLVITLVAFFGESFKNLDLLFFFLLPVLATALVLIGDQLFLAGAVIKGARVVYLAAFWVFLADKAAGNRRMVFFFFGIAIGLGHLFPMLGRLVGFSVHGAIDSTIEILIAAVLLLIWGLALISLHVLSLRKKNIALAGSAEADSFNERCEAFSQKYSLSEREREILLYFVRGRSSQAIADILVISNNTVKTHLRNIYIKSGVHSRQKLLDLIEELGGE